VAGDAHVEVAITQLLRVAWVTVGRSSPRWLAERGAEVDLSTPRTSPTRQQARLADVTRSNRRLYHVYLLKEQLRQVFAQDSAYAAIGLLERWLAWASRSQIHASSSSPAPSAATRWRSTPPSRTGSRTPQSRASTPECGC
jgi:transposase